jgi:hypothetical protein
MKIEPLLDGAVRFPDGCGRKAAGAVTAVIAAKAILGFKGFGSLDRLFPAEQRVPHIIGMQRASPAEAGIFVGRLAGKSLPLFLSGDPAAIRGYESRNLVK